MTDTRRLKKEISKSGYKIEHLASELGISRYALYKKTNNITAFKVEEMYRLSDLLKLSGKESREIFFDKK